jgi:hypothetical protein
MIVPNADKQCQIASSCSSARKQVGPGSAAIADQRQPDLQRKELLWSLWSLSAVSSHSQTRSLVVHVEGLALVESYTTKPEPINEGEGNSRGTFVECFWIAVNLAEHLAPPTMTTADMASARSHA